LSVWQIGIDCQIDVADFADWDKNLVRHDEIAAACKRVLIEDST
jgi:hypothetical protein